MATTTKIYITDYAFRGVFVKAGEHQVTFEYKPKSLYWGNSYFKPFIIDSDCNYYINEAKACDFNQKIDTRIMPR